MLKSAVVCNGNFRVYVDGHICRIINGKETEAKTYHAGRSGASQKYKYVYWIENGKRKYAYVHRLIAEAFIPNPDGKREVNHKDGDKENNAVTNLEWVSRGENTKHAYENGLIQPMRDAERCKKCGRLTRSKSGYCPKCQPKIKSQEKKIEKEKRIAEKYQPFETYFLTERQAECVEMAKTGMSQIEISRLIGLTRERVRQLLKRSEELQFVYHS